MSQIPSRHARPQSWPMRPLERQRPVAPVVTPMIPVGSGGQTMAQALGLVAQAGQLADHVATEITELESARANRRAEELMPFLQQELAEGRLEVPENVEDIPDAVRRVIDPYIQGSRPAYAEQLTARLSGVLNRDMVAVHTGRRELAINEMMGDFSFALDNPDLRSTQQLQILAAARKAAPNVPDDKLLPAVLLPAIRRRAVAGDVEHVDRLLAHLPERFADERIAMRRLAQDTRRQHDQQAENALVEQFHGALNNAVRGEGTWVAAQDIIEQNRGKAISEQRATSLTNTLREHQSRMRSANEAEPWRQQILSDVIAAAEAAGSGAVTDTGGLALLFGNEREVRFTDSTGREHRITRQEAIDAVLPLIMERIAQESSTPQQALARQVQFAARNGVVPKQWSETVQAGSMAMFSDMVRIGPDGEPAPPPASVIAAHELNKAVHAVNPRFQSELFKSGDARTMFELSRLAERYMHPGDPASAISFAMKAASGGTLSDIGIGTVTSQKVRDEIDNHFNRGMLWWSKPEISNNLEIGNEVYHLARGLVASLKINPETAVEEASQHVRQMYAVVGGQAVYVGSRYIPGETIEAKERVLNHFYTQTADRYLRKHGATEGLRNRDLTLVPGEVDGTFILYRKNPFRPVDNWQTDGFFTINHVHSLLQAESEAAAQARLEVIAAEMDRARDPHTVDVQRHPGAPFLGGIRAAPRIIDMRGVGGTLSPALLRQHQLQESDR